MSTGEEYQASAPVSVAQEVKRLEERLDGRPSVPKSRSTGNANLIGRTQGDQRESDRSGVGQSTPVMSRRRTSANENRAYRNNHERENLLETIEQGSERTLSSLKLFGERLRQPFRSKSSSDLETEKSDDIELPPANSAEPGNSENSGSDTCGGPSANGEEDVASSSPNSEPFPEQQVASSVEKQRAQRALSPPNLSENVRQFAQRNLAASPLLVVAKKSTEGAIAFSEEALRKIGKASQDLVKRIGRVAVVEHTIDDVGDSARKVAGADGLCSKCQTLPVAACFQQTTDVEVDALMWATPLSRIIYHADWCRMCRLLLQMLCRSEFDPLRHPDVAQHVPEKLKGLSMEQWTAKGWAFTDKNWPFGQSEHRSEGATYILGPLKELTISMIGAVGRLALSVALDNSDQFQRGTKSRQSIESLRKGIREMKEKKKIYPLSCVLQIVTKTHIAKDSPGLLYVDLFGRSNRSESDFQNLSSFRLRAVEHGALYLGKSNAPLSYGRLLDRQWIDVSTGRHWVKECESGHGSRCSEWDFVVQKPAFLRVIDVEQFCIVESPEPQECRFVALSYVWGGAHTVKLRSSNIDALMQKHGLLKYLPILPRTILDAIEVVRQLGERFLWLDSLCILQENSKEAMEQIATMDRIYSAALATLVAADGASAYVGLRGVRRELLPQESLPEGLPRRIHQLCADFDRSGIHVIAPININPDIHGSVWNSRAWTFQERLLSKRLIFFTGGQMIWHCRNMTCREDMAAHDSGYFPPPLEWLDLNYGYDKPKHWMDSSITTNRYNETSVVRSGTFNEYARMIQQYTHRAMTRNEDVINAMAGLLDLFQHYSNSDFIFGLPKDVLDLALLWRPVQKLERRKTLGGEKIFPSWSWVGWIGMVVYGEPSEKQGEENCEGIRPLLRWYMLDKSTGSLKALNGTGRGIPLRGSAQPEGWESCPFIAGDDASERFMRPPRLHPLTLKKLNDEHLVFLTSCVQDFRLGFHAPQKCDRRWKVSTFPTRFSIRNRENIPVGTILLDGDGPTSISPEKHEFVVLAEAQYRGLDNEPKLIDYLYYLVMLIEWDSAHTFANRLGLGRIEKEHWKKANPVLRVVCLE